AGAIALHATCGLYRFAERGVPLFRRAVGALEDQLVGTVQVVVPGVDARLAERVRDGALAHQIVAARAGRRALRLALVLGAVVVGVDVRVAGRREPALQVEVALLPEVVALNEVVPLAVDDAVVAVVAQAIAHEGAVRVVASAVPVAR